MFTIKTPYTTKIQVKSSIFICNLINLETIENLKPIINKISNEHRKANHNCYAYRIGINNIIEYSSDDGEPSGSAGKPILNALIKNSLTNVVAIVTRYFGGTKLGIRGLIDTYSEVVENTIKISELIEIFEKKYFNIECDYNILEILKNKLDKIGVLVESIDYTNIVKLLVSIKREEVILLKDFLEQERIYYNDIKN